MTERLAVLDASAVLAFVLKERAWETVGRVLPHGVIPAPNLAEVLYRAPERGYRDPPDALYQTLLSTGLIVEPVTEADGVRAAALITASKKARTTQDSRSLSLGDGLCCAVAERLGLKLAGGDNHWMTLDLQVEFLPIR